MNGYQAPSSGPGFPEIRWSAGPDGIYIAEWLVGFLGEAELLPLALATRSGIRFELSLQERGVLRVALHSSMKPNRPEVYGCFYQLIRPAFDQCLILSIEGGEMNVHRYVIEGTYPGEVSAGDVSANSEEA